MNLQVVWQGWESRDILLPASLSPRHAPSLSWSTMPSPAFAIAEVWL